MDGRVETAAAGAGQSNEGPARNGVRMVEVKGKGTGGSGARGRRSAVMTRARERPPLGEGWYSDVLERLREITAGETFRSIGGRTGTHPESVRRYFQDGRPCARFLAEVCRAYGVDPAWLLLGWVLDRGQSAGAGGGAEMRLEVQLAIEGGRVEIRGTRCRPASAGK